MQTTCVEKFMDEEAVDEQFINDTFWANAAEELRRRRTAWITVYRQKTGKRKRSKGRNSNWIVEASAVERIIGYTILYPKGLSDQPFKYDIYFEDKLVCLAYCLHYKHLTAQAENIVRSFVSYDLWRKTA